jgi:NO-binding membrane sensor protein with MHYT domain
MVWIWVGFIVFVLLMLALDLWRRVSNRRQENSAECLLLGAYIGGVATWAAAFADDLEPTAVVAGFTCVVYAVSLWRRVRA